MDIQTAPRKKIVLALTILVVGIGIFALLVFTRPKPQQKPASEKAWPVRLQTLKSNNYTPHVIIYGLIESPITANMKAAIDADVMSVPVREGQLVKTGQRLIQLDDSDVVLRLQQHEAEVANLEAQIKGELVRFEKDQAALKHEEELLTLGQRSVDRQAHLTKTLAASESQLDAAKEEVQRRALDVANRRHEVKDHINRLAKLKADLKKAQSLRDQAKIDVARATIKAPFNGKITAVSVAKGDRVRIGDSLLQLFDTGDVEIRAQIPGQYIQVVSQAMATDQQLTASMVMANKSYDLVLTRLSGQVEKGKVGVDGLFTVTSGGKDLPLGRTVEIDLTLPLQQQVFAVPIQALYQANYVYRLEDDRIYAVFVNRVGQIQDKQGHTLVLIKSDDLKSGDAIIINQLPNVVSGLKVQVIEE